MAQQLVITPELRKMIGKDLGSVTIEIEKGMIRGLAEATDDRNPLWTAPEFAKKTRYQGIIASPALFTTLMMRGGALGPVDTGLTRVVDGGGDYEFFKPVRPGDMLTAHNILKDLYERTGKMGQMLFQVIETTWTNQKGEFVVKAQATMISY